MEAIPDLIISDLMMPKMDGYDLCRRLKNDPKTSHIPIILLTARAAAADKLTGLQAGADDYLIKPFRSDELLARVHNLIAVRRNLIASLDKKALLAPSDLAVTPVDQAFLENVRQMLEQNAATIAEIAFIVGFGSSAYFTKSFREEFGMLPSEVVPEK